MSDSHKIVRLVDAKRAPSRAAFEEGSGETRDSAFIQALALGQSWAERALLERETPHVERVLSRILGGHPDLDDLAQEVFVRTFERIEEIREPEALHGFITAIAVFVAREAIRKKQRRRWLVFLSPEQTPELEVPSASPEARAALRAFYDVVGRLGADARIAFTLRFVEGMELTEIADACDVSLATIKRRIKSAEAEFMAQGRAHPELIDWFEEGTRWRRIET